MQKIFFEKYFFRKKSRSSKKISKLIIFIHPSIRDRLHYQTNSIYHTSIRDRLNYQTNSIYHITIRDRLHYQTNSIYSSIHKKLKI